MTRFNMFTDEELDVMEEAFCNEGLKYLVFEVRKERESRRAESEYKEWFIQERKYITH